MSWFINNSLFFKEYSNINAKGATSRCILMGISKNKGLKRLNNSVTYDRGVLEIWILVQIEHHLKQ